MQGVHGELEAAGGPLLQEEDQRRHHDGDDGQRRGEVEVGAVFAQVLVVDQDGEGLVALTQQHGSAEVREGLHEDHQRRGQDGGHGEGHHHPEEPPHTGAAHVGGGLHEGVVDVLEGAVHVDEDQGEELQGLDQENALEAIDAAHADVEHALQELRDDAAAAQQHDPGVGPDEGSRHGAEDAEDEEDLGAPDAVEGVEIRDGDAQDQGDGGDAEGHLDAVDDGAGIVALGEELGKLL